jgi:uncharacterized protein (UPF0548 family)
MQREGGPAAAEPTYREVGATRDERLPPGYGHVHRDVSIGRGRPAFAAAAAGLFGWQMHRRAGFGVSTTTPTPAAGVTVLLRAGWGPFHLTAPCRVIYTVEEDDRRGFGYGTLPGHPEQGEESFVVEISGAGDVRFRIRAFSRPASLLARAGGPFTRLVQRQATNRYLKAMRDLARR